MPRPPHPLEHRHYQHALVRASPPLSRTPLFSFFLFLIFGGEQSRKGDIDGRLATAKVRAKEAASAEAGAHKSLKSLAAERAATIAK